MRARIPAALVLAGLLAGPAAAADEFQARFGVRRRPLEFPLIMRVGLMETQHSVRFQAPSDAWLDVSGVRRRIPAGTPVRVQHVEARPGPVLHQVCLKTFDHDRLGEADAAVEAYQAQGVPARLVAFGDRLVNERDEQVHDHRRVFVAVEETQDEFVAADLLVAWTARGERPFLHQTRLGDPFALVRVEVGDEVIERRTPVTFAPDGSQVRVFHVEYGQGEPWHGFEDRDFHGNFRVDADRWGTLAAVNVVELETYLKGVVPSEILPSSPFPALRAQAVAARGETLAKLGLKWDPDPYDTCASTMCQVYGGITKETPRTSQAVAETAGVVMRQGARIVDAVYAAVCGGHTEANDLVWSSPPDAALRGGRDGDASVPSPVTEANLEAFLASGDGAWCKGAGVKFRWTKTMTQDEMRASLKERADLDVGQLRDLVPVGRGRSGRLLGLTVVGSSGSQTIMKELPVRLAFGGLRSALFAMDKVRDAAGKLVRVSFRGAGWGHGVGMCQVGARAQAAAGRSHEQILKTYFTGVQLERVDL